MATKSLIKIVQTIAGELNLPQPTVVLSSQDQNVLKLLAMVRATCEDLLLEKDWQALQKRYVLTTVAGQASYPFPADIERFLSGTFFDTTNRWPLRGPLTPTQYEMLLTTNLSTSPFERYRVWNNEITFYPTPGAVPLTLVYEYVSNAVVIDAATGASKPDFQQDSDVPVFDYRVVVYGAKVKWLAAEGFDTTAALVDFQRALERVKGTDSPAPRLSLAGGAAVPLISTANIPDGNWVT